MVNQITCLSSLQTIDLTDSIVGYVKDSRPVQNNPNFSGQTEQSSLTF